LSCPLGFDVRCERRIYIAHDYLSDNLNLCMAAMHKDRFRLFIARYKFCQFRRQAMQDQLKLDNFICFAVYTAGHALNRVYKPLLDALGLTYPQYLAMVSLWEQDGQTVGGLGEKLFLESSTLTPLLKRLETAGYVRRERSREDERVVVIRLSEEGLRLKEKAIGIPGCIAAASGRDAVDLTRLQSEIVALREALNRSVA